MDLDDANRRIRLAVKTCRALIVSAQHRDLVTQHQNLDVLSGVGPGEQRQPARYAGEHQIRESEGHSSDHAV